MSLLPLFCDWPVAQNKKVEETLNFRRPPFPPFKTGSCSTCAGQAHIRMVLVGGSWRTNAYAAPSSSSSLLVRTFESWRALCVRNKIGRTMAISSRFLIWTWVLHFDIYFFSSCLLLLLTPALIFFSDIHGTTVDRLPTFRGVFSWSFDTKTVSPHQQRFSSFENNFFVFSLMPQMNRCCEGYRKKPSDIAWNSNYSYFTIQNLPFFNQIQGTD